MEETETSNTDEFIPCELCEEMVRFTEYESHMEQCMQPMQYHVHNPEQQNVPYVVHPLSHIIPFLFNIPAAPIPPNDDDEEDEQDNMAQQQPIPQWVQQITHLFDPTASVNAPLMLLENNMNEYEMNTLISELMGGNVYVGVKDVSKAIYRVEEEGSIPVDDTLCAICQECLKEKMKNNVDVVKTLCNHYYCKDCILQWFGQSKKCPVCMHEFESDKLESDKLESDT